MLVRHSVLMFSIVSAIVILFGQTEVRAAANGDGQCSAAEAAAFDCAVFGANVIEYRGASDTTCTTQLGPVPCTAYFYTYNGDATNQVNVGIPDTVQTRFTSADANAAGCGQLDTTGGGDPTTGFLENDLTQHVCRIAANLDSFPAEPPNGTNFFIAADRSFAGKRPWQLRQSRNEVWAAELNGPFSTQPLITSTGQTLTTKNGDITYQVNGGQVSILPTGICATAGACRVLSADQVYMCVVKPGADPSGFPGNYECDVVYFVDSDPNIQVGDNSICVKYIGRTPVTYWC